MQAITVATFADASIDRLIELRHGEVDGQPWTKRKAAAIDADCDANPSGIFVAESDGAVVGYGTTRLWPAIGMGWIPNLAVAPHLQGQGIGRRLVETALDYFREQGMTCAKIETLAHNAVGEHLYTSLGFRELVRQIHFTMDLCMRDGSRSWASNRGMSNSAAVGG